MLRQHGRAPVLARLGEVLQGVLQRPQRRALADRTATPDARAETVAGVRRAVASALPAGASVLVISRGDPELVRLPERAGHHFPATADGRYAGFHPADSRAALEELERRLGEAQYLIVPAPSFWWLDFYREFAEALDARHERVWSDASCVIYRLSGRKPARGAVALARTRGAPAALNGAGPVLDPAAPAAAVDGAALPRGVRPKRSALQSGVVQ
jgi:hypothetical protein